MANLFGEDDTPNRFRPSYRELTDEEKGTIEAIKAEAEVLAALLDQVPDARYKALALTSLEQSVMWAVKGLTA